MQKLSKQAHQNKLNYIKSYQKEKYVRKNICIPKEKYEQISASARIIGISENEYIKLAIDEKLQRDNNVE